MQRPGRLASLFEARAGWVRALAILLAGAAMALGQAPVFWPFASLLALFLALSAFVDIRTVKNAALFGWLLGGGYFAASMFWIVEPFLVDAPRFGWMAPFALLFMAFGLALFWAVAFGLSARISKAPMTRLLALVATFGLAELARSYVLTGFPWGLLGYIWVDTPLMQLAAYIGPHGVGALTLLLVVLPVASQRKPLAFVTSALVLGLLWAGGSYRLAQPMAAVDDPVRVRLIQPNARQDQKWDPEFVPVFFRRMLDLSAVPAEDPPDLVIWPEAAVTWWLDEEPDLQQLVVDSAVDDAQVVLGIRRLEGRRFFNSLALLGPDGMAREVYDKVHLVPFGEYVPFGGLLSRFGIYGLAADEGGGFSAGEDHSLLDLGPAGRVVPLICYESIFPHLVAKGEGRADWILQVTNDAWFGELAGPQQHLAQARVRAIEQGLPFIRTANTGVSAVIDARGQIIDMMPLGSAGKLDADVPPALGAPIYSRSGDWPILIALLFGLALVTFRRG